MSAPSALTFGKLLKRYRTTAGLTQEELAERAGLSVEGISALERGVNRSPRRDTVDLLADALALSAADRGTFAAAARTASRPVATPLPTAIRPAPLAPGGAPPSLVGREQDLARIERHLAGDGPPVLLLSGEPGIGKSRLLYEAAECAPALGWTVLAEGCHRRSGQEPFAPLLGALQRSIASLAATERAAALDGCVWLSRLLPELAGSMTLPALSWELPPEQERRLMFGAIARYLANVAGLAGTLLVLDDLQWAGADALDLLAGLVQAPAAPLRVLAAYPA
jgi:transcriptional regulator with XRE-family HTH domain